jgi:hypothetical protein
MSKIKDELKVVTNSNETQGGLGGDRNWSRTGLIEVLFLFNLAAILD